MTNSRSYQLSNNNRRTTSGGNDESRRRSLRGTVIFTGTEPTRVTPTQNTTVYDGITIQPYYDMGEIIRQRVAPRETMSIVKGLIHEHPDLIFASSDVIAVHEMLDRVGISNLCAAAEISRDQAIFAMKWVAENIRSNAVARAASAMKCHDQDLFNLESHHDDLARWRALRKQQPNPGPGGPGPDPRNPNAIARQRQTKAFTKYRNNRDLAALCVVEANDGRDLCKTLRVNLKLPELVLAETMDNGKIREHDTKSFSDIDLDTNPAFVRVNKPKPKPPTPPTTPKKPKKPKK